MTKALILAAGQGSRLRPLTNDRPKCLVTLMGRTLLDRQITVLNKAGIEDIHIVTGYRSDQIESLGFKTTNNTKYETTNMVESLFCAKEFIRGGEEDLIIAYGDIVYQQENLMSLLDSTDEISLMIDKNWRALWSVRLDNPLDDAETLILDAAGFVKEVGKKPNGYDQIHGQYTGLIKVRKERINAFISFYQDLDRNTSYDGNDFEGMYMTSFLQLLINAGWGVKAVEVSGGWLEVDTVEDIEIYNRLNMNGELTHLIDLEPL